MPETALLPPSPSASPAEGDAPALPAHLGAPDDDWLPPPQAEVKASFLPPATPALRTYPDVAPARPQKAATDTAQAARGTATRSDWSICVALMVIAALFRIYLMNTVFTHVDSDQAVLGLMAYHVQAGER